MEPTTYQLQAAGERMAPGRGVLAAFVPSTEEGAAVFALACDPRHDPGQTINELAPATMAFLREQHGERALPGPAGRPLWVVIDGYGRFHEAVPTWGDTAEQIPAVRFQRFEAGVGVDAFFREAGPGGEVAIELLSSIIEEPDFSEETPTQAEFLGTVEAHSNLPAPGAIFRKVEAAAADGDANAMSAAIQVDPVISATLINSANAARFAAGGKTASVPQAVVRLGTSFVRRVVFVAEMMARYQKGRCDSFDYRGYWHNAIATGAALRGLMDEYEIPARHADDAFTIGLLSGIGWLAIAETFPTLMAKYVERCKDADPITKARAQQEVFPCAVRMVSERYIERFDFPPHLLHAVCGRQTEDGLNWHDSLARAIRVAQSLAPFECNAVPSTVPVPEPCREEWERWRTMLAA